MYVYIIVADTAGRGQNKGVYNIKALAYTECAQLNAAAQRERLRLAQIEREHVRHVTEREHPISLEELARTRFATVAPFYRVEEHEIVPADFDKIKELVRANTR